MKGSVVSKSSKFYVVYDVAGPSKKRKQKWVGGFETRKEAESYRRTLVETDFDNPLAFSPGKMTIKKYMQEWLNLHKDGIAPRTYERYEELNRLHIEPYLSKINLQELQPIHVQKFIKLLGEKLKPVTIKKVYRVLSMALKQAVGWQLIDKNPAEYVKLPKVESKLITALNPEEISVLLGVWEKTNMYVPANIALRTGMRLGEVLGLRWQDVDLENAILYVRQSSIQTKAGQPRFGVPKTPRSRRSIDISPKLVQLLRTWKKKQLELRLAAGEIWQEWGLVCTTKDGRPLNPSSVSSRFTDLAKRAGINANYHMLRHSHASLLIAQGEPITLIAERLGHADTSMTLRVYGHMMPNSQRKAVDKLENMLQTLEG